MSELNESPFESRGTDNAESVNDSTGTAAHPVATNEPTLALEAYYDVGRKEYVFRNAESRWLSQKSEQFVQRLRYAGYRSKAHEGETVSPAQLKLLQIQDHNDVNYVGPLAGRQDGRYVEGNARFLVTEPPTFITPQRGDWSVLKEFMENLFMRNEGHHSFEQWHTVLTWLKGSITALRAGEMKEGQALAMAGPPQSGKSLFQRLITHFFGGRECKPFLFMAGKTPFNAELFAAEHQVLEDEHMSRQIKERLYLGASIKTFVANEAHNCHGKGRQGITLRPFWRLTITLNDEPEALLVLPPLDEHVADKIIILRASRFPLPMPTETSAQRNAFWDQLMSDIPAFLHYLLNEYETPPGYLDQRYVVKGWHHPEIAEALHGLSPSSALLSLIDTLAPWGELSDQWNGTAEELRALLLADARTNRDAQRLLEWPQVCGNYLADLAKRKTDRVRKHRTSAERKWVIYYPRP